LSPCLRRLANGLKSLVILKRTRLTFQENPRLSTKIKCATYRINRNATYSGYWRSRALHVTAMIANFTKPEKLMTTKSSL